nr:hypothetical protein [Tanacetum cinerariifolium]
LRARQVGIGRAFAEVVQLVLRCNVPVEVIIRRKSQYIAARCQLNLRYRVDAGVRGRARYLRQKAGLRLRKAAGSRICQLGETDDLLLLHLNEAIATIREKEELFQIIARKLRLIFSFDMMGISIFDEELLNKRLFFKDYTTINPPEPPPANISVFTPIAGSPVELLLRDPRIQHIELREQ